MLIIKNKIDEWTYSKLIDFLLIRCDLISYRLPNYNKFTVTEEALKYYPECKLGVIYRDINNNDFEVYKKNIQFTLDAFEKYCIKEYEDFKYHNSIQGYDSEVKLIKLSDKLIGPLKAIGGLYDWQYPNMPEDLCFFSKGKCFLKSVAHEKLCFIYTDDKFDMKILKKIGLKFVIIPDSIDDIPLLLNYELKY